MGFRIQLKSGGRGGLFQRITPAEDCQHVGSAVFSGPECSDALSVLVIERIFRTGQAVKVAHSPGILRALFYLNGPFFRSFGRFHHGEFIRFDRDIMDFSFHLEAG